MQNQSFKWSVGTVLLEQVASVHQLRADTEEAVQLPPIVQVAVSNWLKGLNDVETAAPDDLLTVTENQKQ